VRITTNIINEAIKSKYSLRNALLVVREEEEEENGTGG
jgi:hypothetical protein